MRHEPYKAFEGEVFTLIKRKRYALHQKVKGIVHQVAGPFESPEDAESWARANVHMFRLHSGGAKLFYSSDLDDC